MTLSRRTLVTGSFAAASGFSMTRPRAAGAQPSARFTPEMFGAKGDGVTDDSAAFAALSARVSALGGGEVAFRKTTYLVGTQRRTAGGNFAFEPGKLLEFIGCTRPLVLFGNGARIRCADGLRYGTFDRETGAPTAHPLPAFPRGERATPYRQMILVSGCTGAVTIRDLELDGNVQGLVIGGPFGDKGRQIPAQGLMLDGNTGGELVSNLHTHHHAQDGVYLVGVDRPAGTSVRRLERVRAEYNGRQGLSILAGHGYRFVDCAFRHTGRAGVKSPPGAGVDIEPRARRTVRDLSFETCVFADNAGVGMVADRGDSADVTFAGCKFIGTTGWGAWPEKPGFVFRHCTFIGAIVRCFGSDDAALATRFDHCTFTDDPRQSPSGLVYIRGGDGPIVDLASAKGVRFDGCTFVVRHGATLPWSLGAIYANCTMEQRAASPSHPRGTYLGVTRITGNARLAQSRILGTVVLNGRTLARKSQPANPLADGR